MFPLLNVCNQGSFADAPPYASYRSVDPVAIQAVPSHHPSQWPWYHNLLFSFYCVVWLWYQLPLAGTAGSVCLPYLNVYVRLCTSVLPSTYLVYVCASCSRVLFCILPG